MKCLFLFVDNKDGPRHLHSRLSACRQMIPTLGAWAYRGGRREKNKKKPNSPPKKKPPPNKKAHQLLFQ